MVRRRTLHISLSLLGAFLVGTVVILSSVSYYLAIQPSAYLTELEVPLLDNVTRWNASDHGKVELIPRIIHQTWKSETLPLRWKDISQACRDMMPDYEYKLWTDASSREFIAEQYPWFLDTFDNYIYPIQRADAIRYFVLHHFGGVYVDLDIGCLKPVDPLLIYPIVLPKTIPVGVSNDLMFAEKGHPFMAQTIHNLVTFDHSWILNYPTVMFSTGPMFLSLQYGLYTTSHHDGEIRVLPKSLYGKNAKDGEAPHSFFSHFYGSSWHADDAAFIGFLGNWGKGLMWIGLLVLLVGLARAALPVNRQRKYSLRRVGGYEVILPRWSQRNGRWVLDMGWFTLPASGSAFPPSSPASSAPASPLEAHYSLLNIPYDETRPSSPASSDISSSTDIFPSANGAPTHALFDAVRRARNRAVATIVGSRGSSDDAPRSPQIRRGRDRSRGVLFFMPAIFTQSQAMDLPLSSSRRNSTSPTPFHRTAPRASQYPREKQRYADDLERAGIFPDAFLDDDLQIGGSSGQNSRSLAEEALQKPLVDLSDPQPSGSSSRSRMS